jgi:hypothetical protein
MFRWTWMVLVLGLAAGAAARESEPGRTDGPEGSEYGRGGYGRHFAGGRLFLEGNFGAAAVSVEDSSRTDLIAGLEAGYRVDDWLAFQIGYGHIAADSKIDLFSIGMRSAYNLEPFNYYFSLGAELYSPDRGEEKFGIAPGVGAEMVLSDHLRVGLGFQHDFIFADETIGINRFTARVQFAF